ncbi:hypothetical protein NPIL_276031 [Nephila pilipes]|uniref:Uncharacterized protein n=1 Tax=Nephila pilipes TaxID=299642 RepID=A0A8X6QQA1_NEPPI|nr:hypothetical protein NPIL_276031 [Nephila pilipes]
MYYIRNFFPKSFSTDKKIMKVEHFHVWEEFAIIDCIRAASLASAEKKLLTLNACWMSFLSEMVEKGNISALFTNIVNTASALSSEDFADVTVTFFSFRVESLNEKERMN